MIKHLKYLRYLVIHKWYVGVECFKMGLFWQGLVHDCSKCLPSEWMPYVEHFEGKFKHTVLKGKHENSGQDVAFEKAWQLHCRRNKHHPEHWIKQREDGSVYTALIPTRYVKEMLCDWVGANKAQGGDGCEDLGRWYYSINKHKICMNPTSREYLEVLLDEHLAKAKGVV